MARQNKTREAQYQACVDEAEKLGVERLGMQQSQSWRDDPKHLVFNLSRYKFVAKMLSGSNHVLEIGCGDAFGTRIVRQEVCHLTATDFDKIFIEDAKSRMREPWIFTVMAHDLSQGPVPGKFDGIYALDVLEHVAQKDEKQFMETILASLDQHGVLIIGMPSLESQLYASERSKVGHINCKSMPDFKSTMQRYFHNVFMFSMNDEVVHTGFHKMANYLFAIGCSKR
jgi:cyclopropane fatty-acyl-phospholipid synthase-like methyltransferase